MNATPLRSENDGIARAAVIGAGTMGTGIALAFANAGIPVALDDSAPGMLERARGTIESYLEAQHAKGRIASEERAARAAAVAYGAGDAAVAASDVAIEAVFERLDVKRAVFERLGALCRPDAMLATNTSTLDVDAIASAAPRPERSLGLHFFSPAHVMRLLEIVRGARTSRETLERALALGARLGKVPVVVGNCDGFVGNRMLLGYRREAEFAVLAGTMPSEVDAALEAFGFAMGPFKVADLAGIDIGVSARRERLARGAAPEYAVSNVAEALVDAGRLGQKSGAGWYRYEPGDRSAHPDSTIERFIAPERERLAIARRAMTAEEIVERCVFALVLEGARILQDGIAASEADIDTIWVNGYGFPKARGGPMRYARDLGLARVLARIEDFARADPAFWQPPPLLGRLAAEQRAS